MSSCRSLVSFYKLANCVNRLSPESIRCVSRSKLPFSTSSLLQKLDDRKINIQSAKRDEGIQGAKSFDLDISSTEKYKFLDEDPSSVVIGRVPFMEIPICSIKVTRNNTHMAIINSKGFVTHIRTCGIEGYKNAKKGTNVAAQATGLSFGMIAQRSGVSTVRIVVKGLGPGRMSSVKGLQMSGMEIVSITDETPTTRHGRPRKMKRL